MTLGWNRAHGLSDVARWRLAGSRRPCDGRADRTPLRAVARMPLVRGFVAVTLAVLVAIALSVGILAAVGTVVPPR